MTDTDLAKLAEELRQEGIAAETESRYLPDRGPQFGLVIDGFFHPLWELNEEGNQGLLQSRAFESIRKKRHSGWTFARKLI